MSSPMTRSKKKHQKIAISPQKWHLWPHMHRYSLKCDYSVYCPSLLWWEMQCWGCNELLWCDANFGYVSAVGSCQQLGHTLFLAIPTP